LLFAREQFCSHPGLVRQRRQRKKGLISHSGTLKIELRPFSASTTITPAQKAMQPFSRKVALEVLAPAWH